MLDRLASGPELLEIIKTLPANKSPGPDGLTYELYKKLDRLAAEILACLANAVLHGPASQLNRPTFCQALIVLLPKKGDPSLCKNWRPISLINSDYKIITAFLTSRLSQVIKEVIGEEQVGFVPGRSIFHPILAVKAAINEGKRPNCPLDLEKAYDRVDHLFLFQCLSRAGLPSSWINALQPSTEHLGHAYWSIVSRPRTSNWLEGSDKAAPCPHCYSC